MPLGCASFTSRCGEVCVCVCVCGGGRWLAQRLGGKTLKKSGDGSLPKYVRVTDEVSRGDVTLMCDSVLTGSVINHVQCTVSVDYIIFGFISCSPTWQKSKLLHVKVLKRLLAATGNLLLAF